MIDERAISRSQACSSLADARQLCGDELGFRLSGRALSDTHFWHVNEIGYLTPFDTESCEPSQSTWWRCGGS
jgi:hypothetical protein